MAEEAPRPELWTRLAYVLLVVMGGLGIYLASRPGGRGPIVAYMYGPTLLGLSAFVLIVTALLVGRRRPPIFASHRRRPFVALLAIFAVSTFPFPYPSSRENRPSAVRFRLPVEGEWRVYWGGDSKQTNRMYGYFPDRRWALHLVLEGEGGRRNDGGGGIIDCLAYGKEVLAPADGTVVVARNFSGRPIQKDPFGVLLVLEVAPDEYVFLSHLDLGSLRVKAGDRVRQGEVVASVGHSGRYTITPEAHVAIHLQTTPVPLWGEAIPWRFHDYEADGRPVESGLPRGGIGPGGQLLGQRVSNLPD